jgi:hypothetical protein
MGRQKTLKSTFDDDGTPTTQHNGITSRQLTGRATKSHHTL